MSIQRTTEIIFVIGEDHLAGPSRVGHYFNPVFANARGASLAPDTGPVIRPDGKVHDWVLQYEPLPDGSGRITVTFHGVAKAMSVPADQREPGATFDRFGFFSHGADGNC